MMSGSVYLHVLIRVSVNLFVGWLLVSFIFSVDEQQQQQPQQKIINNNKNRWPRTRTYGSYPSAAIGGAFEVSVVRLH